MRRRPTSTTSVRVASVIITGASQLALLAVWAINVGCASDPRLPNYRSGDAGTESTVSVNCAKPDEGCPCASPGVVADCGELRDEIDGYITCLQGVRLCRDDKTWGACIGDFVKQSAPSDPGKASQALGAPESCTDVNPCDPLCRQVVDTGAGITQLPEGMCSTASGLTLCPLCGYSGPVADLQYASFPTAWQRMPTTCSADADTCPLDTKCVNSACQTRTVPCHDPNVSGTVDLTLGKPCFDPASPNDSYHIPLCNRGDVELVTTAIRIAVGSQPECVNRCAGPSDDPLAIDCADSGIIDVNLPSGATLAPGACIEVNASNSVATNLDFSDNRALLVNVNAEITEGNFCNNGSALIAQTDGGAFAECSCVNLECAQTDPTTTLIGRVYDPSGRRPLSDVIVYVPNGPVGALLDEAACDSCNTTVSGSPIAWTKTDPRGGFSLSNVPSGVDFPLVIQLGRWRRQFVAGSIDAGQSRWVALVEASGWLLELSPDDNEPPRPADPQMRLRLPSTERRCVGDSCAGEGDIPKTALILGDGDPMQCTLRRIGIADSEFTDPTSFGRIQLYSANGMRTNAATAAFGVGGLLAPTSNAGSSQLLGYSMLLAPCNAAHALLGRDAIAESPYGSGPSVNGWPDPTASDAERANVKFYTDAGGRLVATHWLSMDLVYLNAGSPVHAKFDEVAPVALLSPFAPSSPSDFATAIADYATSTAPGFAWRSTADNNADPLGPLVYLFGNNVSAASNTPDAPGRPATLAYAPLHYDIDTSHDVGDRFLSWATVVGATADGGSGGLPWTEWSSLVSLVRKDRGIVPLLTGDSTEEQYFGGAANPTAPQQQPCLQLGDGSNFDCGGTPQPTWGGDHVGMYQFDTPLDAAQKCGRVAVASGHVSQHSCFSPSNTRSAKYCGAQPPYDANNPAPDCDCFTFPTDAAAACDTSSDAMTSEELAFEYLYFSASQCLGELAIPPAPHVLPSSVFTRDFEADCAPREIPVWRLFSWQAVVPTGTRIDFTVATADTQEELANATEVPIGTATQSTNTWTTSGRTIDSRFRKRLVPPDVSRQWLRVKASFAPFGAATPTLTEWRVVYNCVASE